MAAILPDGAARRDIARARALQRRRAPADYVCMSTSSSWLIPDGADRERMLDMDRRIAPVRKAAFGVLAVSLALSAPWTGWWTLLPLVTAAGFFRLGDLAVAHSRRPEYPMFAAWAASEIVIAISVAMVGGPTAPGMSWLAIPVVTLSARFSSRGILLGVATAIALVVGVGFAVDHAAVIDDPTYLLAPATTIIAIAMLSTALMRSDVHHRSESVIDSLTGMLNRAALVRRAAELTQQAELTGSPVGIIVGDVDHFKAVNDELGHATGDAVLTDVAYLMRKRLRAFDLAYRVGGEEFLVLLPGATAADAAAVAETLRQAVAAEPLAAGRRMTMSFGVSASGAGGGFDFDAVFAEADAALYEAKRSGRDAVCCAPGTVAAPA
jgi:diguanylate cyclase (GGDEF)-like protein